MQRVPGAKRLDDIIGLKTYISTGATTARKIAVEAGAVVRLGGRTLYDIPKIDAYIDKLQAEQAGSEKAQF